MEEEGLRRRGVGGGRERGWETWRRREDYNFLVEAGRPSSGNKLVWYSWHRSWRHVPFKVVFGLG